jgi:hypothetical protein
MGEVQQGQYKFDGGWKPALDPAEIGPNNFQVLENLRYGEQHPVQVSGYTKVNADTAIATYVSILNGHQLRPALGSDTSIVLVHAEDASSNSRVYYNTTAIPSQGDFEATQIHSDAAGSSLGRFSDAPGGNVAYCNGKENYIWCGSAMRCSAFFLCDDSALANPRDYTDAVNNTLTSTGNTVAVAAASTDCFVVMTTRPLQGVNFTVSTANGTASTLTCNVYTASGWAAVSSASDGTTAGGIALAQSGTFSFASTVSTAIPMHFEGLYLYAYRFVLSAGSATISNVTVDAPWQPVVDLWDGVPRQPIYFGIDFSGDKEDFTAHVQETSSRDYPIGALMDGLTSSDEFYIMFEERMAGVYLTMLADLVNAAAATLTVAYWNGSAFSNVSNQTDGTKNAGGTKSLNQSGLISWTPPAYGSEFPYTISGRTGYIYRFTPSGTLTGTHGDATESVVVDLCTGIPAQYYIPPFSFPSTFKNRFLLCGFSDGGEGSRVDYGPGNYADAFNGSESSMGGIQSLYFGNNEPLTAGISLYNRYGSNVFEVWLGFKKTKTFQLKGSGPEDWEIDTVSENIGCPAPLTLVTAELGFEVSESAKRNIAIWVSTSGPYAYDGAILYPIKGIENFFDPDDSECVNFDAIANSRGWYDPIHREYNLLIPSGTGQTTPNKWLVLDLERREWFEKVTGSASMPLCGFLVSDTDGNQYNYGGLSTGYMVRLEYGDTWDGTGITTKWVTGDFWPSGSIWHLSRIRRIKVVARKFSASTSMKILYRFDTNADDGMSFVPGECDYTEGDCDYEYSASAVMYLELYAQGSARLVRATKPLNALGWTHAFGAEVTNSGTDRFEPIGWGIEYEVVRDDHQDA